MRAKSVTYVLLIYKDPFRRPLLLSHGRCIPDRTHDSRHHLAELQDMATFVLNNVIFNKVSVTGNVATCLEQ